MNYTLSRILGWIADNKLSTFLGICLFAFVISTIALASQKSHLQNDLEDCRAAGKTPGGNGTTPGGNGTNPNPEPTEKPPSGGGGDGEPGPPPSKRASKFGTPLRLRRNVGV